MGSTVEVLNLCSRHDFMAPVTAFPAFDRGKAFLKIHLFCLTCVDVLYTHGECKLVLCWITDRMHLNVLCFNEQINYYSLVWAWTFSFWWLFLPFFFFWNVNFLVILCYLPVRICIYAHWEVWHRTLVNVLKPCLFVLNWCVTELISC